MRKLTGKLRILAWSAVALFPIPAAAQILAYVGSDSVTLAAFSQRYQDYLDRSAQTDSLQTRYDVLQQMVEEAICTQFGRDHGLDRNPAILRAGRLAWREVLLIAVAQGQFADEVTVPPDEIEAEYRYRNTALLTRYLTLPDSLTAVDYLQQLDVGEPFESLALQACDSASLLDRPGELGWKFPQQLDSTYGRRAYRLTPGQCSEPLRTTAGYQIIQLLGKEFRPDHGHFERVKYQQQIAAQLRPSKFADTARNVLEQWASSLPYAWRRRGLRKILRSGILDDPIESSFADPAAANLAPEVLFTLSDEPYTFDWLLSRLDLLLPEERAAVTNEKILKELVQKLFMWDELYELAIALPQADSLLTAADSLQQATTCRAVRVSLQAQLLRQVVPPEDSLRQFLADHHVRYTTPALANLEEIVVRDSALALSLRDSLLTGNFDFAPLARRHTQREWARITGGRLGWVPLRIYGPAGAALVKAATKNPNQLVGPLQVGDYYILAQLKGYRVEKMPSFETLQPRLRQHWITANRPRLLREAIQRFQTTIYPTVIDSSLVSRLEIDVGGLGVLPAVPDSLQSYPAPTDTVGAAQQTTPPARPDSSQSDLTPADPE
ncbi:MAG: peptidylprolyl isomerase [Candidatus Neomarinimicrobiota bacterium]